jgi:hypothetical protein
MHRHFSTLDNLKLVMKQDAPTAGATHVRHDWEWSHVQ